MENNNALKDLLGNFDGTICSEQELEGKFRDIASQLISNGYFLINGERRIYMTDLEFYYHEEDTAMPNGRGKIKDPIMYHTFDHERDRKYIQKQLNSNDPFPDITLPYFPLGSLNLHQSGIDITFENPEKHYRASILIRGYQVEGRDIEQRSTYLYDDMFSGLALPLTIEWKWEESDYKLDANKHFRKNVYKYDADGTKTQCDRPWRFKRQ